MKQMYTEPLVLRVNELFYDLANGQYEDIHTEMIGAERQRWRKNIETYLQHEGPITLADIGSGAGLVAMTIADLLHEEDTFICADLSSGMLEIARTNILAEPRRPRFEFRKIEGDTPIRLPFDDASLDAVTMNSVLHHIKDTEGYMREVERVLKPGGLFFVAHEPNRLRSPSPPPLELRHHKVLSAAATHSYERDQEDGTLWACFAHILSLQS